MAIVHFYTKASHNAGLGHLYRCLRIISVLQNMERWQSHLKGHTVDCGPESIEPDEKVFIRLWLPVPGISAAKKIAEALQIKVDVCAGRPEAGTGDVVVVDRNGIESDLMRYYRDRSVQLVTFDDSGPGEKLSHISIDANRTVDSLQNSGVNGIQPRRYRGPEYSVLHPELCRVPRRNHLDRAETLLISMGGTDKQGYAGALLKGDDLKSCFARIIITGNINADDSTGKSEGNGKACKCVYTGMVPDIHRLMYQADLILCTAGITMLEAHASGMPAVVLAAAPHQMKLGYNSERRQAALFAGDDLKRATELVSTLAFNKNKRMAMGAAGRKYIDGHGIFRVANLILAQATSGVSV